MSDNLYPSPGYNLYSSGFAPLNIFNLHFADNSEYFPDILLLLFPFLNSGSGLDKEVTTLVEGYDPISVLLLIGS